MSSIPNSTQESPVGAAGLQPATTDKESGRYVSCQMPKVHLQCCLTRLGLSEPSHWDLDGQSGCKGVVAQPWLLPCHRPARVMFGPAALRRWKLCSRASVHDDRSKFNGRRYRLTTDLAFFLGLISSPLSFPSFAKSLFHLRPLVSLCLCMCLSHSVGGCSCPCRFVQPPNPYRRIMRNVSGAFSDAPGRNNYVCRCQAPSFMNGLVRLLIQR